MFALARMFARDARGASAVEYGLVTALVSIGIVAAIVLLGGDLGDLFNAIAGVVAGAGG